MKLELKLAQVLMSTRGSKSPGDEKASSDKENDLEDKKKKGKGGKQQQLKQKVSAPHDSSILPVCSGTDPHQNLLKVCLYNAFPYSNCVKTTHAINLSA